VFDSVAQLVQEVGQVPDGSVVTCRPRHQGRGVRGDRGGHEDRRERDRAHPSYDDGADVRAANLRGARISPNCLGIIRPGIGKMGGIGGPAKDAQKAYKPGRVGVMSRSGGMTTEISSTLSAAGLGVSTAVSIGGGRDHRLAPTPS